MARLDAVVVAGGESRRMGGLDKLSASLLGRPLLAWAVDTVAASELIGRVVVVGPPERLDWLVDEPTLRARIEVVPGGRRRQESAAAGVRATSSELVLIHDGARPLATPELVARVTAAARRFGAAIPVLPVLETVKRLSGETSRESGRVAATVPRASLAVAQTPQAFRRDRLEQAWAAHPPQGRVRWSDEAALLERAGVPVHTVRGEPDNLKVTVADDLVRAEALLAARLGRAAPDDARIGYGQDSHPFGPASGLALGGIRIAEAPGLFGHSDGDAALHAVADALLGAAAMGDLGRLFPAGEEATAGMASSRLLAEVVALLRRSGLQPRGLDLTIVGARPRLGAARLEAMRAAIAGLLAVPVEDVSVKASSGNLGGDEGAGRVVSARAVARVGRSAAP